MTEKEAWIWLAEKIDGGVDDGHPNDFYWNIEGEENMFLCNSIKSMHYHKIIGDRERVDMLRRIPSWFYREDLGHESCAMAPTTKEGSLVRIKFCLDRAAELEAK